VNGTLLLATWIAPLLAAGFSWQARGRWLPALAVLPALAAAMTVPAGAQIEVPWLLLGAQFGLDGVGRVFLGFTAVLWLAAGLQAALTMETDPRPVRFRLFFLLAMAGNLWLIVGQDLVSFYLGFALMGLAAYGLVIHKGDPAALRAGRVYLVMTLVAELALFAALVMTVRHTGTLVPQPHQFIALTDWVVGLLVFGLGIKAGLLGLHVWLPLAHPAAPVPASAVLSGTMIKAALIGWMRFLPLGEEALPGWGGVLMALGMVTVLYAIPIGLTQTNPKVVLAYSSVGKMGLMTAVLGAALLEPPLAPALVAGLALYAAHHGLAKGALFLGVGIARETNGPWVLALLAMPALVLAGAPFTSGALVKGLVKPELAGLADPWGLALTLALTASTLGTTLLMARFLVLVGAGGRASEPSPVRIALPWLGLVALVLAWPFLTGLAFPDLASGWPVLAGCLLALILALSHLAWAKALVGLIPPGDLLHPLSDAADAAWRSMRAAAGKVSVRGLGRANERLRQVRVGRPDWPDAADRTLRLWPVAGTLFLALAGSVWALVSLAP
jgi:hydrogenase-4 component B